MDPQLEAQLTDIHFGVSKLLALIDQAAAILPETNRDERFQNYRAARRFCFQMGDICDALKEIL